MNSFKKDRGKMQTSLHHPQARRDHGGTHFILLVEPMFVLACLASLPGTPRRALDAAGLVLAWFGVCNAGSVEKTSRNRFNRRRKPRAGRMQDVSVIVTYECSPKCQPCACSGEVIEGWAVRGSR